MSHAVRAPSFPHSYTGNGAVHTAIVVHFVRLDPPEPARGARDRFERLEAERLTPPPGVLEEMARRSPPPQEWWDEDFEELRGA
jgi:hypothetical protein